MRTGNLDHEARRAHAEQMQRDAEERAAFRRKALASERRLVVGLLLTCVVLIVVAWVWGRG